MKTAYFCHCRDGQDAPRLRQRELERHLAYIESIMDRVLIAGALRDEDGVMIGSCLIYDADSREQALSLLHEDPYFQAGVWSEVDCRQMRLAAGQWIGGRGW